MILILLLFVSAVVNGQTPAGYIKANMRFKWTAGIFDSALHVPQYNGTPSGIRNGAWVGDGAVAVDTVNNLFYFRSSGAWHSTSSGSGWLLTGNSGTTSSNFIGTTDDQPLSFRVNNRWAGRIYTNGSVFIGDSSGVNNIGVLNAGFGQSALQNNTSGVGNTGSGVNSLGNNTLGSYNTGSGLNSLGNNSIGSYNTGIGLNSLKEIVDGGFNTGIGANVGNNAKQKVDAVHQILIGAGTYGTRDSISVIGANFIKGTIVRGKLIDSTLSAGAGTKAVRWNSSTGEFTYADTTAGGGGGGWSLTGNAGTNPASNFIGTTDDQPLSFRVNNRWAGRLTTSGNIFWGDSAGVNNIGYSNVASHRFIHFSCRVHDRQFNTVCKRAAYKPTDILREAASAVAAACIQKGPANTLICTDSIHNVIYIAAPIVTGKQIGRAHV